MHRGLLRQLHRVGLETEGPPDPEQWRAFLEAVETSYEQSDRSRYRLERALQISSDESRGHADRHEALSRCAQALLAQSAESPEEEALNALLGPSEVGGAWIVRNVGGTGPVVVALAGDVDEIDQIEKTAAWMIAAWNGPDPIRGPVRSKSDVSVPIVVQGTIQGVLGARAAAADPPRALGDLDLVNTSAAMVGAHWTRLDTQARLETLVASKDRFVASISHELRTPLTAVVGFSRELEENWHAFSSEEARGMVELIVEQSEEVAHMVEDLLVVARSDIGKISLIPETLYLRQQVKMVCGRIGDDSRIRVTFEGDGVAYGDPTRVRQILRNLLTNAVRYGGSTVRVRIMEHEGVARLEVRDDGPGVPDHAVGVIFEAFQSAHQTPTQPNSVGLGLWVARKLATLMGGGLEHRREHDETIFTLTLPQPQPVVVAEQVSLDQPAVLADRH